MLNREDVNQGMPDMTVAIRWRLLSVCLIVAGCGVSLYLLVRTFQLISDMNLGGRDVCAVAFGVSCDDVLLSRRSWVLGVPLAGWGVVLYTALGATLLLRWLIGRGFGAAADMLALVIAVVGAAGSVVLAVVMLSGWAPLCPLCLVVHVVNFALLFVLKRVAGATVHEAAGAVWAALRFAAGLTPGGADSAWITSAVVNVVLAAACVWQWIAIETRLRTEHTQAIDPVELVRQFEATPRQTLPIHADDPRWGSADARVQIVVFSSFQCPGCQHFAAELPALRARFSEDVSIVFKHYPLSTVCNPRMPSDRHPRSCPAAHAAQSAAVQGRFWEFHDALFQTGLQADEASLAAAAGEARLDVAAFERDRTSDAIAAQVQDDIALGSEIAIDATPAVYLNGRLVQDWHDGGLALLIRHILSVQQN